MALSPYATTGQKCTYWGLRVIGVLLCIFLICPIFVFVPLSFNDQALFHYPIEIYSLRWYETLLESSAWTSAAMNSVIVAISATLLATVLGVSAAVGLWLAEFPGKKLLLLVLMMPMIVPSIIIAVSMYLAFAPMGLNNSYWGLILAHTALASPLVVITVSATLARFDRDLLRAAGSLGADPVTAFRRVTLPLILPGVVTGSIFAFSISFDDVVVALFVTGPVQRTLPVQMYLATSDVLELTITAAAVFLLVLALVLMTLFELLKRSDRLSPAAGNSTAGHE